MTQDKYEHARQNAKAWAEDIIALHRSYKTLLNLGANDDHISNTLDEMPLSVMVRSGWCMPGGEPMIPAEYEILLSTGGPALRIVGDLSLGAPQAALLEMQDWGVPWREANGMDLDYRELDAALLWFAGHFYYGE